MPVKFEDMTPQQVGFYGVLSTVSPLSEKPWLNMFTSQPPLPSALTRKIKFRTKSNKVRVAALVKKGAGPHKILKDDWLEVEIEPGSIKSEAIITAEEMLLMQPEQATFFLIAGQQVNTANGLIDEKLQALRDAIDERRNIMCAQAINDGKVLFSDGKNYYQFEIAAPVAKEYSATSPFSTLVVDMMSTFKAKNRKKPTDILIGEVIVKALLQDEKFMNQAKSFNPNIASASANETALVIAQVLGQQLEQMDISIDEKGVAIIPGNHIKLIDRTKLRAIYGSIEVINPKTNLPDILGADFFADINIPSKKNPTAELFAECGFFPVITDEEAIHTYIITIA